MEDRKRMGLAFAALQRFWVAILPAHAEQLWADHRAYHAGIQQKWKPGQWYRFLSEDAYIKISPGGDSGQFHAQLPSEIDPSSVVVIPPLGNLVSICDRMKALLHEATAWGDQDTIKRTLEDLDRLQTDPNFSRVRAMISSGGRNLLGSGLEDKRQDIAKFLSAKLEQVSHYYLSKSWVTGFEVAALTLFNALARQFASTELSPPPELMAKIFDLSGPSLQNMVARFIHECFLAGAGDLVEEALVQTRKESDIRLANAALMQPMRTDSGEMDVAKFLDGYYAELQQAGIQFLAVYWGYRSALAFAELAADIRKKYEKRMNTAEEKFVRTNSALLYAVNDLDGSKLLEWQTRLRLARKLGDEREVAAILGNVFDSNIFYPVALRKLMETI